MRQQHTLRYSFQARLQFRSFQHNLDKALPPQMHPGQDHSGLVAQLGMDHGFPLPRQCATVLVSSPQILHAFLLAPGGQQLAKQRGSCYWNRAAHALCQPLLSESRGFLLVWYLIQANPSDNQAIYLSSRLHGHLRTTTQAVKQRSSGAISLLAMETFWFRAPSGWCRGRNHPMSS